MVDFRHIWVWGYVFLGAEPERATLEDADLGVQSFGDERDVVFGVAAGRDPLPLHLATAPTGGAPELDVEVDA